MSGASAVGGVPIVRASDREFRAGCLAPQKGRRALQLFRDNGVLLVENAYPRDLIDDAHRAFMARHGDGLMKEDLGGGVAVGHQRIMIGVTVSNVFANPALFASPILERILENLLGDGRRIGSFTAVAARPGADDQQFHVDHPPVSGFGQDPYAVTLMIPLIALDERVGATCFVRGSHRLALEEALARPRQVPSVSLGSCYLMDYRLAHYGMANRSDLLRPVLSIVHCRAGFTDTVNFNDIGPLTVPEGAKAGMEAAHRRLFGLHE